MAHDDRNRGRGRDQEWRDERGRETQWSGDQSFGGGWGNQTARPQRLGDRNFRGESDDPYAGQEPYESGRTAGYGAGDDFGGTSPIGFEGPGLDSEFGGPRFDRADVGSTGTHGVHPVSSPFGAAYGAGGGYGGSARRYARARRAQQSGGHDPHYSEWRSRQMEQLDRDYEEYCREKQARFEQEFGSWRERRGRQRQAVGQVREHMEVVGSDGSHVGTVDCTRGEQIILTRSDPAAGGAHHSIPCSWIESVDDKVRLNLTADEATRRWRDEESSGALFERGGDRGERSMRHETGAAPERRN